jgi:hypothetical protein
MDVKQTYTKGKWHTSKFQTNCKWLIKLTEKDKYRCEKVFFYLDYQRRRTKPSPMSKLFTGSSYEPRKEKNRMIKSTNIWRETAIDEHRQYMDIRRRWTVGQWMAISFNWDDNMYG